ncbi:MAG: hypothetical protein GVY19_08685 [Bacteroidetes bacterium]|jgi:chemotaxis signal transduction protein|nr:hypothetical protein [Bacteroidota bacterium]
MQGTGDKEISIFCCKVAGQLYAFQVTDITNVLESDHLTDAEVDSSLVMDLAWMNEKQIPVVDLGKNLHDAGSSQSFGASIIVVKNWYQEYVFEIGLYIDSVVGVYDAMLSSEGAIKSLENEERERKFGEMKLLDPQLLFSYAEKGLLFNHYKSTEKKKTKKDDTVKYKS